MNEVSRHPGAVQYLVVPMRPEGTDDWSVEQLATVVTRDCLIGTGLPLLSERTPV